MISVTQLLSFEIVSCCNCGVRFGLPDGLHHNLRETHRSFHCPNGHSQHFAGKTEAERLREQLRATETQLAAQRAAAKMAKTETEKAQAAAKRTEKRLRACVCPKCNRTFTNSRLARHMKTKHPEVTP